jgi:ferredoxin-thioredoxin reductase catalytic subunit
LITDYKIVVICVTDPEVGDLIRKGGFIITDDNKYEWDAKAFAKRIALIKGIYKYNLKKIFTFHGNVKNAKAFTDITTPYSIQQTSKMFSTKSLKQLPLQGFHVNGTMSSGVRDSLLREFEEVDIAVMSNARCLTEGVNVPAVDTVAFIDPKRSLIDIVQATGRAMRKASWKEKGYIFIPVVVEKDANPEKFIESSDFDTVWKVLQAMLEQDEHLQAIVSKLRILQGKGEDDTKAWKAAMNEYAEKIEFFNLPVKIDKQKFIKTLYAKTIEMVGRSWDFWYGLTLKYKERFGTPNCPVKHITSDGFMLVGRWQSDQRKYYRHGTLSIDKKQRLENIGFAWNIFDEIFEKGFIETLKYNEKYKTTCVPKNYRTTDGFKLGAWQQQQRQSHKKNRLSSDKIHRLNAIGFIWDILAEAFENGFYEPCRYKKQFGTPNAPSNYITAEGFKLGIWHGTQRKAYKQNEILSDRVRRLESIGFAWDLIEDAFEEGFKETLKYKEKFGNPNAPTRYKTPEGFKLGAW